MHSTKTKNSEGVTVYEIWDGQRRIGSVFDPRYARLFAASDDLLECAQEALSYVNLFGQISLREASLRSQSLDFNAEIVPSSDRPRSRRFRFCHVGPPGSDVLRVIPGLAKPQLYQLILFDITCRRRRIAGLEVK